MTGYIKLYRGWRDTDGLAASECFSECEAWLWLLENAAWKTLTRWNAKGEEITLEAGQIHVSLRSLSTAWGWKKDKVSRFLARLERVKKARQLTGQSGTVLVIENWAKYQGGETVTATASATAVRQPCDTQEEGKEGKEEKNTTTPPKRRRGPYAFEGQIIKVDQAQLDRWQETFSAISDLKAELMSLDGWYQAQPKAVQERWFFKVPSNLNTKHQERVRELAAAEARGGYSDYGPC